MASQRFILDACIIVLRYLGIWRLHSDFPLLFRLLHAIYGKLMLSLVCIFAATLLADLCANYKDLMIATDDGCFLAGISLIGFKQFIFHLHQAEIEHLIGSIHDPVDILRLSSDPAISRLVDRFIMWEKLTVYVFTSGACFLIVFVVFLSPTSNGSLPIRAKFPFDTTVQPMHSVAFCIQAIVVANGLSAIMAMDTIVLGFCRFTRVQLQVLAANYEHCQNIVRPRCTVKIPTIRRNSTSYSAGCEETNVVLHGFVSFDPKDVNEVDDSFLKRFETCVKHHQRLIGIIDETNELFGSSMLVQLFASSTMICLTGFNALLGAKDRANLMKFGLYLGVSFSQLFLWCLFGNTLIDEGDSLAASQWSSGWENEEDLSAVTTFLIMSLIRTRRPMALTAGKFYAMSLETFLGIVRGSYSFFALLTNARVAEADGV